MMTYFGLGLLVLAWAYQAYATTNKEVGIQRNFLLLYMTGAVLLVVDGLMYGVTTVTMLNSATALLAALVVLRMNEPAPTVAKASKSKSKSKKR